MSYKPHQLAVADQCVAMLQKKGLAYLAGEPRTGKTRTAIKTAEILGYKRVLVLTKKAAIPGWESEIKATGCTWVAKVTNYEQAKKLHAADYDFVVLDEAHNLGSRGKPTNRVKDVRAVAFQHKLLLLSGTPTVESATAIYHQTVVSKYSPFTHKNFYDFFREWGIRSPIFINGREIESYKKSRPELMDFIGSFTIVLTQKEAGITVQARDQVHTVPLRAATKAFIDDLKEGVFTLQGREYGLDSDMGIRNAVYQAEFGGLLLEEQVRALPNNEVLEYVLANFPPGDTAVMVHYRSTRLKFAQHYGDHVYSSDGHAEGVNLSAYKHFVIVGTSFSGAKAVQRRQRTTLMDLAGERVVHHITTDAGISRAVYSSVSAKQDFNLATFRQWRAHARIESSKNNS